MINNVTDLTNRTMVESNILKSIILSSTDDRLPSRDDILIHDYQIANSVTINSILSNYIVNLKYAWQKLSQSDEYERESYFQIVDSLETSQDSLSDETKMVMEVVNGVGTFKSREMVFQAKKIKLDENVVSFHCLDTVWYGMQRNINGTTQKEYDNFVIVDGMNDFYVNPNPYGTNIFDAPMLYGDVSVGSFNEYALSRSGQNDDFHVMNIVQNLFYGNRMDDGTTEEAYGFTQALTVCRYILCMDNGLYGLQPIYDQTTREFAGLVMHNLGSLISNIDLDQYNARNYIFKSCSFQVVDGVTSLIIVVLDSDAEVQHYLFINEDSYDTLYGMKELKSVVVDGLVVDVADVFRNVEAVRNLDSVCIALTNYGFWDVEPNTTKTITYSYNGAPKEYSIYGQDGNSLKTKIVRPEFEVGSEGTFSISEYDTMFTKPQNGGNWTHRFVNDEDEDEDEEVVSYLDAINSPSGTQHKFVGGTQFFAIYNHAVSDSGEIEPAYIVPRMRYPQFKELIFSSSDLLNDFLDYFYEQSVHSAQGEYYLEQNHSSFASILNNLMDEKGAFTNYKYQAVNTDLIGNKFDTILHLVQNGKSDYGSWNLHTYCANLASELNNEKDIGWLIKPNGTGTTPYERSARYLMGQMDNWFIVNEYDQQRDSLRNIIVDNLVQKYPLLGHFQDYFMEHVGSHLSGCPRGGISEPEPASKTWTKIVSSVRDAIRSQVTTALVLKDGNYEENGIQSYLHHHTAYITKPEIKSIMSIENIKNQMILAVKSTPFFGNSHSYSEMKRISGRNDLFKLTYNEDFAKKTNLAYEFDTCKIYITSWDSVKNFLYPSGEELQQDTILKALVRTQIYRPLFFKFDEYSEFTKDRSKYKCETHKTYVDHDGIARDLYNGTSLNLPTGSGFSVPRSEAEYSQNQNILSYHVEYDAKSIEDCTDENGEPDSKCGKFVYQDIEYYIKRDTEGKITRVLYNQFQKEIQSTCKNISIDNNTFELNNRTYQIEIQNNIAVRLTVDDATGLFQDEEIEFKCEIVDDKFKIDGIWYSLVKNGTGYTGIQYAGVDDNRLVSVGVDSNNRTCQITDVLKFVFSSSNGTNHWNRAKAVLYYSTRVIDHVESEWCEFDGYSVEFSGSGNEEKSFEWYLANRILSLSGIRLPDQGVGNIRNLGDGVLYSGGLDQTQCTLRIESEVSSGYVVSKCVLKKMIDGYPDSYQYMGVLYDQDRDFPQGKVFYGNMGADGLFTPNDSGDVFIMVDPTGKKNNTNMVKIDRATWNSNVTFTDNVGTILEPDEQTGIQRVVFTAEDEFGTYMTIGLSGTTQDNDTVFNWYQVNTSPDGTGRYTVRQIGDIVHAFKGNVRYSINLATKTVSRLRVNEMTASIMDFSTLYTFYQLRENLLNNLKQYMMNEVVQKMVDNGSLSSISLNPNLYMPNGSGLFLDMFTDDLSLTNFMSVNSIGNPSAPECGKFLEVFKNNINDIDDSKIYLGRVYRYLEGKMRETFGDGNSIVVLDTDTITPQLVGTNDTFRYEVLMDLHLMQNKNLMKSNVQDYQDKWLPGDLTVKDLRCSVEFTPVYTARNGSTPGSMMYTSKYVVHGGEHTVEYGQIIYCINKKVKMQSRTVSSRSGVDISEVIYSDNTRKDISHITKETIAQKIENIFNDNGVKGLFADINNKMVALDGQARITVDSDVKKNYKYNGTEWTYGNIWELGESIPPTVPPGGTPTLVNRGNVIVDGDIYDVSSDDSSLDQQNGPGHFAICDVQAHKEQLATDTEYDSVGNLEWKKIVKGWTLASKGDVERLFTVENVGKDYFLNPRNSNYGFLNPSIIDDSFSINLSKISHLENLADKLTVKDEYVDASGTTKTRRERIAVVSDGPTVGITCRDYDSGVTQEFVIPTVTSCLLLSVPGASTEVIEKCGNDFTPGSVFAYELDDDTLTNINSWINTENSDESLAITGTFSFTGNVEQGSGTEEDTPSESSLPLKGSAGWFGQAGSFDIEVVLKKDPSGNILIKTANITEVVNNSCRTFTCIPVADDPVGEKYYETKIYTLVNRENEQSPWYVLPNETRNVPLTSSYFDYNEIETLSEEPVIEDGQPVIGENGLPVTTTEYTRSLKSARVTFKLNMQVQEQAVAIKPESNDTRYYFGGLLVGWVDENNEVKVKVKRVFPMCDFYGHPIGSLKYCYVYYPINLTELASQSSSEPSSVQYSDVQYKNVYFDLNNNKTIRSDGVYSPFALHVIKPDETTDDYGQIYNRFYEVAFGVTVAHTTIQDDHLAHGKFWMDKAGTVKSMNHIPTHEDYRKLICNTNQGHWDTVVPETMREAVLKLVDQRCKFDNDYFNSVLVQLRQFLQMVLDELEDDIHADIGGMCLFRYNKKVKFAQHTGNWNDTSETGGLFGYQRSGTTYATCRDNFNNYLKGEFKGDFSSLKDVSGEEVLLYDNPNAKITEEEKTRRRNYNHILRQYSNVPSDGNDDNKGLYQRIYEVDRAEYHDWGSSVDSSPNRLLIVLNRLRDSILHELYRQQQNSGPGLIADIFIRNGHDYSDTVRFMAAVPLNIADNITDMFVANGYCNLIHGTNDGMKWNRMLSSSTFTNSLLNRKIENNLDFIYDTTMMDVFGISGSDGWRYRFGNRDLSTTSDISDQFFIHCHDNEKGDLWYHSEIDGYVYYKGEGGIVDMAYEQYGNSTYVLFSGDNYLYRFDDIDQLKDFDGFILLQKENATMKIETRHSTKITGKQNLWKWIFIDYRKDVNGKIGWTISLYGTVGGHNDLERWDGSPGSGPYHFGKYNTVMFGDSLFDENQLKFHNISKKKQMFDILDIYEVDGNYYGMFKNNTIQGQDSYSVFKSGLDSSVVQKMPYQITLPRFYRSLDDLYSLFVAEKVPLDEPDSYKTIMREISVPDSDLYRERLIDIDDIIPRPEGMEEPLEIKEMVMSQFRPMDSKTSFFVLSNWGFHKIGYTNKFKRVSIDTLDELKGRMWSSLNNTIMKKHLSEKHQSKEQMEYFDEVAQKINQFSDGFDVFSLIPAEFGETQDVGVIPDSRIDDSDRDSDHRPDSVLMSTDILQTQGMVAQTDTNPGIVTCAVSNPDTSYGNNPDVMKSQRNPSIEGTEFYDFMYDSDGKVLMDLYSVPFIYQVNSNNTYDLYINVPTTRTKYLNRIAGTLKPDMTTQVLPEDVRARKNFQNATLPNNLDESTTKLRVYIDRKYISVGNVELVEISGNSIPLQIYRDVPNNGLYDSIALESRWNGEVVELKEPEKDINKVMLEFECYGTDSQSIHIQGKTIVNRALDDKKYKFTN